MRSLAFTIIAKNYLPYARVLMASLRRYAPELQRVVILVDRTDGCFDLKAEDFDIVLSQDLDLPESPWFHFKYTMVELSTAVKPYALEFLLHQYSCDTAIYFDPDIKLYNGLFELLEKLSDHTLVLIPHLTAPLEDDRRPNDLDILRSGAYNLGFIGVRRCTDTMDFLRWWRTKLYDHCVVDLAKGLFVDQRWIDLAPGMFPGIYVLRDPGYNVAYWNLPHRRVVRDGPGYTVNGAPLYFMHFSGFDPEQPHGFSRHQNRLTLDDLGDARQLALDYRNDLLASGYRECKDWPYAFGTFANGFPIPDMGRPVHHEAPEILDSIADPFSEDGFKAFVNAWNSPVDGPNGKPSGINRLAYRIYKTRADVQATMPDIFSGDLVQFLKWVVSSGRREYNLSEVFTGPISRLIKEEEEKRLSPNVYEQSDPIVDKRIMQTLAQKGIWINPDSPTQRVETLNQLISNGNAKLQLSQLARAIYESRLDLQSFFPDPCGRDGVRFLLWFLTYGAEEYQLADALVAPLRQQWEVAINSLDHGAQRLWFRFVLHAMGESLRLRKAVINVSQSMRMTRTIAASRVDRHKVAVAGEPIRNRQRVPLVENDGRGLGVNFIGYLQSEMGTGESVRCAVRAARAVHMPVAVKTVDDARGPYRLEDCSIGSPDPCYPHPINVFYVNADQSPSVIQKLGASFVEGKHNVGCWAWELSEFPDRWNASFQLFDEIWTLSTFSQESIARKSPVPVLRVPPAIEVPCPNQLNRSSFSIPADSFVFLTVFDLLSVVERKNPLGVIEAFARAFERSDKYHLVLKVNHASRRPAEMARIVNATAGLPVSIIDHTMKRDHVNSLIQCCDCLVSLHRSEGFGLTLAEAMYLKKPVIGTAYSGNMDFMRHDNSFLVGYDLVTVPAGCDPYDEGTMWAAPRLSEAIEQMRVVVNASYDRSARAARGQECIQREFSPEAIGAVMLDRLERIYSNHALTHTE